MQDLIFFSSLFITPFLAIGGHELGHLLSGLYLGFKFELFIVGFLGVVSENGEITIFLNTDFNYFGGVSSTVPTQKLSEDELVNKYKTILLSGPLASLFITILSAILFILIDNDIQIFFGLLGAVSLGIFFATTVPSKSGMFFTDRKRFQRLNSKGKVAKIELVLLQIINQITVDNSFKNLDTNKIKLIQTDTDKVIQFWGYYYEYEYYKANQLPDKMQNIKEILVNKKKAVPKSVWKSLEIE